jgi:hypothetical protein
VFTTFPLSTLCIVAIECFDHDPISLAKPHLSMSALIVRR